MRHFSFLVLLFTLVLVTKDLPLASCRGAPSSSDARNEESRQSDGRFLLPKPSVLFSSSVPATNSQPLIGILSQPGDGDSAGPKLQGSLRRRNEDYNTSYIAASYVKWVESAGARPVPIFFDESAESMQEKFNAVNGLLLPGGGAHLDEGPFMATIEKLLEMAVEANDRGDYFPVQGTCLGMEALSIAFSKNYSILNKRAFNASDLPSTLSFVGEWAKRRAMFAGMPRSLIAKLETQRLTMENHEDGTTVERFLSSDLLRDFFTILTTSADKKGLVYVTTIEGKKYPVYGTQWHPEKNAFEWGLKHIPHSADGTAVCQAAANFFVNEARKSTHAPLNGDQLDKLLIYNYNPIFTGKYGDGFFEQVYVFPKIVAGQVTHASS